MVLNASSSLKQEAAALAAAVMWISWANKEENKQQHESFSTAKVKKKVFVCDFIEVTW